jgi:predicted component of type VI protein secretion system
MENDGTVRITLKDVYQQTQSLEKTLSDSMSSLNLTMQDIRGHIDSQDKRNTSADQLHAEHGARITAMEAMLQQAQPVQLGARVTSLERFRYTFLGAIVTLQAAVGLVEYLVLHHGK